MEVCCYELDAMGRLFFQGFYRLFSVLHVLRYTFQLHNTNSDHADVVSRAKPEYEVALVLC